MEKIITGVYPKCYEVVKKEGCRHLRIFKPIKELDAEIRTIREEINDDRKEVYFIVEVGYYESIGEQGLINSFHYDSVPTEEELIKDIKEDLLNDLKEYKGKIALSGREEGYLKILEKLEIEIKIISEEEYNKQKEECKRLNVVFPLPKTYTLYLEFKRESKNKKDYGEY